MQKLSAEQNDMLIKMMEVDFTMREWDLYYDTHPWDQKAMMMVLYYQNMLAMLEDQYAMEFCPLEERCNCPFPWEIIYS